MPTSEWATLGTFRNISSSPTKVTQKAKSSCTHSLCEVLTRQVPFFSLSLRCNMRHWVTCRKVEWPERPPRGPPLFFSPYRGHLIFKSRISTLSRQLAYEFARWIKSFSGKHFVTRDINDLLCFFDILSLYTVRHWLIMAIHVDNVM